MGKQEIKFSISPKNIILPEPWCQTAWLRFLFRKPIWWSHGLRPTTYLQQFLFSPYFSRKSLLLLFCTMRFPEAASLRSGKPREIKKPPDLKDTGGQTGNLLYMYCSTCWQKSNKKRMEWEGKGRRGILWYSRGVESAPAATPCSGGRKPGRMESTWVCAYDRRK